MIFDIRKISPIISTCCFSQNSEISLQHIHSIAKIKLILYHSPEFFTTHITILWRVKRSLTHKMVSRDIFLISGLRNLGSKKICTFENYGLGIIWFLIQCRKLLIHFLFDSLQMFTKIYNDFIGRPYTVAPHYIRSCTRCTPESKSKIRLRTIQGFILGKERRLVKSCDT